MDLCYLTSSHRGGVGLLMKKHIRAIEQPLRKFKSSEYIDQMAKCSEGCVTILVIYRPPKRKGKCENGSLFIDEFSTLAPELVLFPDNLLITGDFD